ncbi:MAG: hypothetical protein LBQ09_09085 [Acidobacteriaceae bacterium]|nr:hypothetical protein [Acidobacteriaceae bacterium]
MAEFCRHIETYLCQKNDGHLIRVVGPSFDLVAGWAKQGVPLKVALRGIDRTLDRYSRKGPRRRPVRIDFCEADVLDVFDEWRRATGVTVAATQASDDETREPSSARRGPSLPEHLERVVRRLTDARAMGRLPASADPVIDRLSLELDEAKRAPRGLRGEARAALLTRLDAADAELLRIARATLTAEELDAIDRESMNEIGAFRTQMTPEAFDRARRTAVDTAVRARLHLPMLSLV